MKNLKTLCAVVLLAAITATSCKKDGDNSANFANRSTAAADYSASTLPVTTVSSNITTNTTWDAAHVWEISGVISVTNGATLTIAPGTFIKSTVNTGTANGVLVITKGAKINAVGTAANPIVFTSRNLLDNNAATVGKPGEFGGVILLGRDSINVVGNSKQIEGLDVNNPLYSYGGSIKGDNSGVFKYVRIEYAGYQLQPNIEVNGLTMGGVGSGTTIDHVQVSYGLDDGFEFFGGTVSPSYLVALGNDDDQYDFDNGYTGTITYAIAVADKNATHSTSSGASDSNGIESDNNAPAEDATFALLPKTHPTLINFSIIGTVDNAGVSGLGYRNAVRERRGSQVEIYNSLITGYPNGIVFDTDASATGSIVEATSVHGFTSALLVNNGTLTSTGNTLATNSPAATFGMSNPWFNSSSAVNFYSPGSNGAVNDDEPAWLNSWTKFTF